MKFLMVGLGGAGQRHVRNLRTLLGDQAEFLAYRVRGLTHVLTESFQIASGQILEQEYAIKTFSDFDEALRQKPNAVIICNPSSLHIPLAMKAAEAGCHLFIEKPISHSCEEVEKLIGLAESKQLVGFVGYQLRFHPCLQRIKRLLHEKAIGRLLAVNAEIGNYMPGWHPYEDYRQMYTARKELGGGVILTQIHEFDYLYWLLGMPRRVFALGGHLSSLEMDVEDVASILMEFTVEGNPVSVHLHQDFLQRPPTRTCLLLGDEGKLLLNLGIPSVEVYDQSGGLTEHYRVPDFNNNQLFLDEMSHFLACLSGHDRPIVTLRDGFASLRMAMGAKTSLEKGQIYELDS